MNSKEGGGTIEPGSTLALALKGPNLEVHSVTAQGGHGVGPTFLVTKGQGNVVAELAGKPALNALRSVVGRGLQNTRHFGTNTQKNTRKSTFYMLGPKLKVFSLPTTFHFGTKYWKNRTFKYLADPYLRPPALWR